MTENHKNAILNAMIKLVAFLGNYGREYENTRHNTAWLFAASLPFYGRLDWQEKFKGEYSALNFALLAELIQQNFPQLLNKEGKLVTHGETGERIFFLKPQTYMNLSGQSIQALAAFYKIRADEILVVHDELELPVGTFSLKWSGGLAGHNGLRSTKEQLGTADFWRLRFGISKPAGVNIADYVLSDWPADERITMGHVFEAASELFARVLIAGDVQRLLPKWGKVKV